MLTGCKGINHKYIVVEWYYVIMDICILQMSYEEAAKHLNIEVQVLRARLYRARRYIRKKYGEEYQEL